MVEFGFRIQIAYPTHTLLKISVNECVLNGALLLIAEEKGIRNKWIKSYY